MMNPQERRLAREALLKGKLTIDQVSELQKECQASGRPFAQAVVARGLLTSDEVSALLGPPGPPRVAPIFLALLAGSLAILVGLLIASIGFLRNRWQGEEERAAETAKSMADSERQSLQARIDYQRRIVDERESKAQGALDKARDRVKASEERARAAPDDPEVYLRTVEATQAFTTYLEIHPEDARVFAERARAYELRRTYDKAVEDLERAIDLQKDLEPALRDRLAKLRLLMLKK